MKKIYVVLLKTPNARKKREIQIMEDRSIVNSIGW